MYKKKWSKTNTPCPCGRSSDSYATDVNGNGFCFRGDCRKLFRNNKEVELTDKEKEEYEDNFEGYVSYEYYPHRGISRKTMEFFDVKTKFVNEIPQECRFDFPNKSAQIKNINPDHQGSRYRTLGEYGQAGLYGLDKFDAGSKDSITIVEGFHDCLATWEMLNGQSAVASVKSSSSGLREIIQDRDKINSFKKIILAIENDEPGQNLVRQITSSGIFDFNKLFVVKLDRYKDANEYLVNNASEDFKKAWTNARKYTPDNIISTFAEIEKSLLESKEDKIADYPFKHLNDNLYGMHKGEVVVIKAPEGVGKTSLFRAIEHHILKTTNHKLGIIHLEEDNATTVKAIAGYELEVPATLPDCGLSIEDILAGYKKAVKDDEGRVHIYSSFEVEDEEIFLDNLRFLVSVAGCSIICLDHISWLATGQADDDERKKLDRLSQKFKLLAKELGFCLIMISHVNDDGKTRGSRNISKVANTVISISRDLISPDVAARNKIEFMIEKARLGGKTGPAGRAIFNQMTGKLEDAYKPIS